MKIFSLRTLFEFITVCCFTAYIARSRYIEIDKPDPPGIGPGDVVRYYDPDEGRGTLRVIRISLLRMWRGGKRDWVWYADVEEDQEGSYEECIGGNHWIHIQGMFAPQTAFVLEDANSSIHD